MGVIKKHTENSNRNFWFVMTSLVILLCMCISFQRKENATQYIPINLNFSKIYIYWEDLEVWEDRHGLIYEAMDVEDLQYFTNHVSARDIELKAMFPQKEIVIFNSWKDTVKVYEWCGVEIRNDIPYNKFTQIDQVIWQHK